jgi:hypothetical protein
MILAIVIISQFNNDGLVCLMFTHHVLCEVHGYIRIFISVPTELNNRDSDMRTLGIQDVKLTIIHMFCTLTQSYNHMRIFLLSDRKVWAWRQQHIPPLLWCGVQVNLYVPLLTLFYKTTLNNRITKHAQWVLPSQKRILCT